MARIVEVRVLDDVVHHAVDGFIVEMGVHGFIGFDQLFFAEFAVLVGVQLLKQILEFLDVVVVDDVCNDEGKDGLDKLTVVLDHWRLLHTCSYSRGTLKC